MVLVVDELLDCEQRETIPSSEGRRGNLGCIPDSKPLQNVEDFTQPGREWARFAGRQGKAELVVGATATKAQLDQFLAESDGSLAETRGEKFSIRDLVGSSAVRGYSHAPDEVQPPDTTTARFLRYEGKRFVVGKDLPSDKLWY